MSSVVPLRRRQKPPRTRWSIRRLVRAIGSAWAQFIASLATYFPPDPPQPSPPLAKPAALREGALLSEHVDARSRKTVG